MALSAVDKEGSRRHQLSALPFRSRGGLQLEILGQTNVGRALMRFSASRCTDHLCPLF
jgi:hypothetical protein